MLVPYDALLLVSFGGPEKPDDVVPFLENVLRGRNVPRERMLEVAEHYYHFGGRSPLNDHNRALIEALRSEFSAHNVALPIYWGNRNWHPYLADAVRQMAADGVQRAMAFCTSAFSSYSGCRQYLENIADARAEVGHAAPQIDKLRMFFNHPGFVEPMIERTQAALSTFPLEQRRGARILFSAHSIPLAMAEACQYQQQLQEASRLVAEGVGRTEWRLVYQSRSGPPNQPWLGPDVLEALEEVARDGGSRDVVIVPIGFLSDHIEVLYDLDEEAAQKAQKLGVNVARAGTVGLHPRFVRMIRELVEERISDRPQRLVLGTLGHSPDVCPETCCSLAARRPAPD